MGELEATIGRKEKDFSALASKLDDEQALVSKVQKSIKEVQSRVEELEEESEAERQARAKAERQRSDLAKELESLGERLNEAGGATHAQVELNKKREAEVGKLRKDLEEANIQHETTLISLKKKHQDAVAEMSEQIDQLSKMKAKIEKDKSNLLHEISDVRAATEEIGRSKASAEKSNKGLLGSLNDANKKVEEANLTLGDFENNKRKIAAENADLLRQLQELENQANMLSKLKAQLQTQLDEARVVADGEAKDRAALLGKFKNLEHELDGVKEHLDEESGIKEDLLRQVAKANNEADMWRSKYETEGALEQEENKVLRSQLELTQVRQEIERRIAEKDEEFLSTKKNFTKGIDGMQTALEQEAKAKAEALRMKKKLEADVSELETALEHANAANAETQKTIKKYHGSIRDAQAKLEGEQRAKEVTRDGLLAAERKANSTQNALEEARTLLEQSDRARRITE